MGYKAKDLTGLRVGLLTVLAKDSTYKPNHLKWLCQCACKNTTVVDAGLLLWDKKQYQATKAKIEEERSK